MTAALEGGEWSAARSGRTLPPGKSRYPFYRRLGGPQRSVWTGGKSRPHRNSILDHPARSSVAIPTELPGPQVIQSMRYYSVMGHDANINKAIHVNNLVIGYNLVLNFYTTNSF